MRSDVPLSLPLTTFFSFSRALTSLTICCAGVRGSFSLVGVSRFFAAVHQLGPVPASCAERAGEGGLGSVCDLARCGGGKDCGEEFIMARTRSSIALLCSASRVRIISASRLLRSRSRLASASNSASVGRALLDNAGVMNEPTRCARLAANWDTDVEGD